MQPINAVADIKASTKGSWHEFDLTRIRTRLGGSPYSAHLSYKRDQIKMRGLMDRRVAGSPPP